MADDLFSRQDELDAEAAQAQAQKARLDARYKLVVAPHGKVGQRAATLRAATHQALLADLELARVKADRSRGR